MNAVAKPPRRSRPLLLRSAVAVTGLLLAVLAASGVADRAGAGQLEAGFQRALLAFGLARALNGVISVAQGTEVALQPAGVGVTLAPGQILDPVNDLVERFSWVMLVATTSFGVQRLLLEVLAWPGVSALLAALAVLLALAMWGNRGWLAARRGWLVRVALFVAVVRFLIPVLAIASESIHRAFIEPRYTAAIAGLEEATGELGELAADPAATDEQPEESVMGRLKRLYSETGAALDLNARLEEYKALASRAVSQALDLIAIFAFQTIVLPLAFLWLIGLAYRMLVGAWRAAPRA